MGRDEEEGSPKEREADSQGSLGFDLRHNASGHSGIFHLCREKEREAAAVTGSLLKLHCGEERGWGREGGQSFNQAVALLIGLRGSQLTLQTVYAPLQYTRPPARPQPGS